MKSSYLCTKRLKSDVVRVNYLSEIRFFFLAKPILEPILGCNCPPHFFLSNEVLGW